MAARHFLALSLWEKDTNIYELFDNSLIVRNLSVLVGRCGSSCGDRKLSFFAKTFSLPGLGRKFFGGKTTLFHVNGENIISGIP